MRKTVILFASFALLSLAACVREIPTVQEEPALQTVTFSMLSPGTKAVFDTPVGNQYPVLWTANDTKVQVGLNFVDNTSKEADVNRFAEDRKCWFEADFDLDEENNTFFVVSPASAYKSASAGADPTISFEIPSGQTPLANSPDEKAMVLYSISDELTASEAAEGIDLTFHHLAAYLRLSFQNAALGTATVQAVSITSDDTALAGRFHFTLSSKEHEVYSPAYTISANTSSLTDVWVAVAPVDLSGKSLTFKINTDQGTLTRQINIGAGHKMDASKIYKLDVNMDGVSLVESVRYTLVTNVNQLHVLDTIIVVSANDTKAMSKTQNTNNRGVTNITKDGNTILDPSSAVEVITLEDGVVPGEYFLKTSAGQYLYAASTGGESNLLKSATPPVSPAYASLGSFAISILPDGATSTKDTDPTNNAASVYAGASNRGLMRYNKDDGLMTCYATGTSMWLIHLYRKDVAADLSPRFKATMPDDTDGDKAVEVAAAPGTYKVYVFGNSEWTASVTGGASLDATSGTGNTILTLTVPRNTSFTETKSYTVTVSTEAAVMDKSYSFNITQLNADPTVPEKLYSFVLSKDTHNLGSNGSYAGNCDIDIDVIKWNVTGVSNATTYDGWRLGGKSLSGVDRAFYTKTAFPSNVKKIVVKHNAKNITVNSFKMTVHSTAADAASGTNPVATITGAVSTTAPTEFVKEGDTPWENYFYRFTYNVTNSKSENKYVQMGGVEIWGFPTE